jgi:hypothetical protein
MAVLVFALDFERFPDLFADQVPTAAA